MLNIFKLPKHPTQQAIEQDQQSITDKQATAVNEQKVTAENDEKARVHGEDGVCCGGCGG